MEGCRKRGEAAAQGQARFARLPSQPECAHLRVEIRHGSTLAPPGVSLPTEDSVQEQGLRK